MKQWDDSPAIAAIIFLGIYGILDLILGFFK